LPRGPLHRRKRRCGGGALMVNHVRLPKWAQKTWVHRLVTKEVIKTSKTYGGQTRRVSLGRRKIRFWAYLAIFHPYTSLLLAMSFAASTAVFFLGYSGLFARLGAIIAATGIIFALTAHEAIRKRLDQMLFGEIINGAQKIAQAQISQSQTRRAPVKNFNVQSEVDKLVDEFEKERRPFELFEASLVLIGTLQWSFGDLLVNKFIACGEWTCSD
ncbi:MAG: hypothetical protein ACOCYW_06725, partial [Roseicyclus sp.]